MELEQQFRVPDSGLMEKGRRRVMKIRYLLFVIPVLCLGYIVGGCGGGGNNNNVAALSCPGNYISNGSQCVPLTGTASLLLNASGQSHYDGDGSRSLPA